MLCWQRDDEMLIPTICVCLYPPNEGLQLPHTITTPWHQSEGRRGFPSRVQTTAVVLLQSCPGPESHGEEQVVFWEVGISVTQIFLWLSRWEAALGLQCEPEHSNPDVTPCCRKQSQACNGRKLAPYLT